MPERTRPIRKEICLNEQELNLLRHKMRQIGTRNFGAYTRKMLIDGYVIKVDYSEQKKLAAAVSRAATSINHICRRINSTGHFYAEDVAGLKACQAEDLIAFESGTKTGIINRGGFLYAKNE